MLQVHHTICHGSAIPSETTLLLHLDFPMNFELRDLALDEAAPDFAVQYTVEKPSSWLCASPHFPYTANQHKQNVSGRIWPHLAAGHTPGAG